MMDIKNFEFPKVADVPINQELLAEAKARGFYKERTPFNDLFLDLLFEGCGLKFKKNLDEKFKSRASAYLKSSIFSIDGRVGAEREAICALLLS